MTYTLGFEGGPFDGQTYRGPDPLPTWMVRSDAVYELTAGGIAPHDPHWRYCWRPGRAWE
ncbi:MULTISPECIES: hypothetical protein [unclassified Streptomyces]|uniref:hypothetical protein n=1 Tax=unclassified Streptomyces TaxID=2593676 RepID=UPI00331C35F4